jgi:hypothetical protein
MAKEVGVIVELTRDGAVDRNLRADIPSSIESGRVVLDHLPGGEDGRLGPPRAGQVVMSVPSPETLRRDQDEVRHSVAETDTGDEPPVIIVEAAEYLREDELAAVLDAADLADRTVIVRILADA